MMRKVRVIGKDGVDTTMIYGTPVEVPDILHYRKRIAAGDLRVVTARTLPTVEEDE